MERCRIIFIYNLEDSDKLLHGMANRMVAWSYNVNEFMFHVKGKSNSFAQPRARKTKKLKSNLQGIVCCSDIHTFGDSHKY